MTLIETVEAQNTIIKLQADVIQDLFCLLMQHITTDEADRLPCVAKINLAAKIRQETRKQ